MNKNRELRRAYDTVCASGDEDKVDVQTFYQQLYESQGFTNPQFLLSHVPVRVSQAMNTNLSKPYTPEEVKMALFQIAPSKAPGVDGFTAGFYQHHWDSLGNDVTQAVLDFMNGGELPSGLNDTSITLIPQVRHPLSIS